MAPAAPIWAQEAPVVPDMTMGDADAPVSLIEYASFTCPHCADFHTELWPAIRRDYVEAGLVRFTYREVYFDRPGLWASMVARCGGEMRFFGIASLLYDRQREWARADGPAQIVEGLRAIGRTAGMDDAAIDACLSDADQAQALVAWYEANAAEDGVRSTPTFVIDGERFDGNWSSGLVGALDAAVEAAQG
ncbi:MAG: DsbA family protein [Paracoccaceae bacterium]